MFSGKGQRSRTLAVWLAYIAFCTAIIAVTLWLVGNAARERAIVTLTEQTRIDASINTALVLAVLDKQRTVPFVLANDHELRSLLEKPEPEAINALNRKFAALAQGTGSSVIYLMGLDGIALVASNWNEPDSFVGSSYQFRPYFTEALNTGNYEYFALGTVSKRPGLYISRRIDGPNGPLGVVTVKLEFNDLEAEWKATNRPIFVVDERNIILISGNQDWRFKTMGQLSSNELIKIRASLQFGDATLTPLPISIRSSLSENSFLATLSGQGSEREQNYLAVRTNVPSTPWHTYIFTPLGSQVATKIREAQLSVLVALLALAAIASLLIYRRLKIEAKIAEAQRVKIDLEQRVSERTADLLKVTNELQAEILEHRNTESLLQEVQQNLVHANRLAILGQVAAGVAHEINQPVATIRAYSDNTRLLIDREQLQTANENLREIASLTERIGAITNELRSFARKGHQPPQPLSLRDAVASAMVLLRSRYSGSMDQFDIAAIPAGLMVLGQAIRIEQVLINLFQNALDAIRDKGESGRIHISAREGKEKVTVTIADNGSGIPAAILKNLFTPFNTSKDNGLGLGLVIAKEILADYGGTIAATTSAQGTSFTIELRKA